MKGISGKVVVYTGAAGLIGRAACLALAKAGAKLAMIDPNRAGLDALDQEIKAEFGAETLKLSDVDTSRTSSINSAISKIETSLGSIDILVNCAYPRTSDWHAKFENIPEDSLRENIDSHLNSYFLMCQCVAPRMILRRSGCIVNFSSVYGLVGPDFEVYAGVEGMTMPAAYSVIKGGISNFTRYLASYLGKHGIRVNAICPGGVEDRQNPSFIAKYIERTPMRRMANTEDIVGPLLFLVSDHASYITGVNLPVDGGWTAI